MNIVRNYTKTGWPTKLKWPRKISALTSSKRIFRFKIGVTASPETRVAGHGGYDEMVIVYSSRSRKNALTVEKHLTELYKDYCDNCDNKSNGGGGRDSKKPKHCVYIVRRFILPKAVHLPPSVQS